MVESISRQTAVKSVTGNTRNGIGNRSFKALDPVAPNPPIQFKMINRRVYFVKDLQLVWNGLPPPKEVEANQAQVRGRSSSRALLSEVEFSTIAVV